MTTRDSFENTLGLSVGDVIVHPYGRTVGEFDNLFATLSALNTAQAHFNLPLAKELMGGRFPERLVVGSGVLALVAGLASAGWPAPIKREIGLDSLRFNQPTFHGDTISASSEIIEVSCPAAELIVKTVLLARNQRGETVVEAVRLFSLDVRQDDGSVG